MKPNSAKMISWREIEISREEKKYHHALQAGAEFSLLKDIRLIIRRLKQDIPEHSGAISNGPTRLSTSRHISQQIDKLK